ncbi:hypothetical protein B0H17DRAFT_1134073 [Mycena rosella]|uniref:Uncharacterized protein n=1 Tax=Mycena rosella TaxID=1033263 RepID=A0AAD7DG03_MYCRO|nr:hypothetical protein B0H17DRAFT_1134073 [Mycena rosella]
MSYFWLVAAGWCKIAHGWWHLAANVVDPTRGGWIGGLESSPAAGLNIGRAVRPSVVRAWRCSILALSTRKKLGLEGRFEFEFEFELLDPSRWEGETGGAAVEAPSSILYFFRDEFRPAPHTVYYRLQFAVGDFQPALSNTKEVGAGGAFTGDMDAMQRRYAEAWMWTRSESGPSDTSLVADPGNVVRWDARGTETHRNDTWRMPMLDGVRFNIIQVNRGTTISYFAHLFGLVSKFRADVKPSSGVDDRRRAAAWRACPRGARAAVGTEQTGVGERSVEWGGGLVGCIGQKPRIQTQSEGLRRARPPTGSLGEAREPEPGFAYRTREKLGLEGRPEFALRHPHPSSTATLHFALETSPALHRPPVVTARSAHTLCMDTDERTAPVTYSVGLVFGASSSRFQTFSDRRRLGTWRLALGAWPRPFVNERAYSAIMDDVRAAQEVAGRGGGGRTKNVNGVGGGGGGRICTYAVPVSPLQPARQGSGARTGAVHPGTNRHERGLGYEHTLRREWLLGAWTGEPSTRTGGAAERSALRLCTGEGDQVASGAYLCVEERRDALARLWARVRSAHRSPSRRRTPRSCSLRAEGLCTRGADRRCTTRYEHANPALASRRDLLLAPAERGMLGAWALGAVLARRGAEYAYRRNASEDSALRHCPAVSRTRARARARARTRTNASVDAAMPFVTLISQ